MNETYFYNLLQRRLAQVAIGPSAIRNQGAPGLITILRDYLEKRIDLKLFIDSLDDEAKYKAFLNKHTSNIVEKFPNHAKSWGAARKGLNLFLREIVYSHFFSTQFSFPNEFNKFNEFVKFMEVPLDKEVANGLIFDSNGLLPKWVSIKYLTLEESYRYQNQALIIATKEQIARVNLDLMYWRNK